MSENALRETIETPRPRSEIREGMRIDWDVPVPMDDAVVLRADIYRPVTEGRYPVILSCGPYGKLLHFEDGYKTAWDRMVEKHPDVPAGSSNRFLSGVGKSSIPRNGCRRVTPACALTAAAADVHRVMWTTGRRGRHRISPLAWSGRRNSPGLTVRSG